MGGPGFIATTKRKNRDVNFVRALKLKCVGFMWMIQQGLKKNVNSAPSVAENYRRNYGILPKVQNKMDRDESGPLYGLP